MPVSTPRCHARAAQALAHLLCAGLLCTTVANAQDLGSLKLLSLEELAGVEISIASKTPQTVADTAAAVYVITNDEIRRSSATSIPELLEAVPGLHVAQIDGNKWSVSSRGFAGRFSNKLLVLLDGRSIYSPLHSGVFWESQETFLPDIARIEVIRGPGAAVWGSNAVNGVINIITLSAAETHGGLVRAVGGEHQRMAGVRYGARSGDTDFRVHAKATDHDAGKNLDGERGNDWHQHAQAGFSVSTLQRDSGSLTIQGGGYQGEAGQTVVLPSFAGVSSLDETVDMEGAHLLARWERLRDEDDSATIQFYADYTKRSESALADERIALDLEYQRNQQRGRHALSWGGGFRFMQDEVRNSFYLSLMPDSTDRSIASVFLQDSIDFADGAAQLTLGAKLEDASYADPEFQPSVRARWHLPAGATVWAGVSRATRDPSRVVREGQINQTVLPPSAESGGLPTLVQVRSIDTFVPETIVAWEAGARTLIGSALSLDVSAFYNNYDKVRSLAPGLPELALMDVPPHVVVPLTFANGLKTTAYGAEFAADWRPSERWRLRLSYSRLELSENGQAGHQGLEPIDGGSPEQQASLRLSVDPVPSLSVDLDGRYVSRIAAYDVDEYFDLNLRIAWQFNQQLALSLTGRNLVDGGRMQYVPTPFPSVPMAIASDLYMDLEWQF